MFVWVYRGSDIQGLGAVEVRTIAENSGQVSICLPGLAALPVCLLLNAKVNVDRDCCT